MTGTATLLTIAARDVREGRQCVAAQEKLVRDLIRHRCASLLLLAERLLEHTRERQRIRERQLEELVASAAAPGWRPDRPGSSAARGRAPDRAH